MKFAVTCFYSSLITYASEIYPTQVRSLGYGLTMTFGRIGTIINPFYLNLMINSFSNKNPLAFYGPLTLLALAATYGLPYT